MFATTQSSHHQQQPPIDWKKWRNLYDACLLMMNEWESVNFWWGS